MSQSSHRSARPGALPPPAARQSKKDRLAQALKANLGRRKAGKKFIDKNPAQGST